MERKSEKALRLLAEQERFFPIQDKLSEQVQIMEDELSEEELILVAAAGTKPSFDELKKRKK